MEKNLEVQIFSMPQELGQEQLHFLLSWQSRQLE
jgi:hypothetical protein